MSSILQRLREGLFTVPSLIVLVCVLLARLTISIDRSSNLVDTPFLLSATVGGGRSIAAVVASATITVTAIVLSITALMSQVAASNYSPRAVAGFLEDRFLAFVIGLVAGTFAYSVLVLASLGEGSVSDAAAIRSASITLTVLLGVGSVGGQPRHVHPLPRPGCLDEKKGRPAPPSRCSRCSASSRAAP